MTRATGGGGWRHSRRWSWIGGVDDFRPQDNSSRLVDVARKGMHASRPASHRGSSVGQIVLLSFLSLTGGCAHAELQEEGPSALDGIVDWVQSASDEGEIGTAVAGDTYASPHHAQATAMKISALCLQLRENAGDVASFGSSSALLRMASSEEVHVAVRERALSAVARLGLANGVTVAESACSSADDRVRRAGLDALKFYGDATVSELYIIEGGKGIMVVFPGARRDHAEEFLVIRAREALRAATANSGLAGERDEAVRAADIRVILGSLGHYRSHSVGEVALEALQSVDRLDTESCERVAEMLGRNMYPQLLDRVERLCGAGNAQVRTTLARALGHWPDRRSILLLRQLVVDRDEAVALTARQSVASLKGEDPRELGQGVDEQRISQYLQELGVDAERYQPALARLPVERPAGVYRVK